MQKRTSDGGRSFAHLTHQPEASGGPVAFYGHGGEVEDFGGFFDGQAAEKAKLYNALLAGVHFA